MLTNFNLKIKKASSFLMGYFHFITTDFKYIYNFYGRVPSIKCMYTSSIFSKSSGCSSPILKIKSSGFKFCTFDTLAVEANLKLASCQYRIGVSYGSLLRTLCFVIFTERTPSLSSSKTITGLLNYLELSSSNGNSTNHTSPSLNLLICILACLFIT